MQKEANKKRNIYIYISIVNFRKKFGNLPIEKPGHQLSISKLCGKDLREKEIFSKTTSIFT